MNGTARRPARISPRSEHFDFEDLSQAASANTDDQEGAFRTTPDLIEESRRIRAECDDLVRLYQEVLDAGRPPKGSNGRMEMAGRATNAAWRRKALLLLLIEELV
jgi:hypothetical protein